MLKKYFIPHHKNNYKPKALCAEGAVFILAVILFIEIIFLFQSFILTKTDFFASLLPDAIVTATNRKRAEAGGLVLKTNSLLQKAAELKARDMVSKGYFAHNSPDGKAPWQWLDAVKYDYNYAGENLAVNFVDSNDVVDAWFHSKTHKENLLSKNYTEIGIGMAKGIYEGKETIFVVQFFAAPAKASAKESSPFFAKPLNDKPTVSNVSDSNSFAVSIKKETEATRSPAQQIQQNQNSNLALAEPSKPLKPLAIAEPTELSEPSPKVFSAETASELAKEVKENAKQIITTPRKTANYFLSVLFTIILLALALKIFIKIKIQHPPLIINGSLLLIIISAALLLNQYLILNQGAII